MSRSNCAIGKDYVTASFKGVSFYCKEADIEGGRRGAEGEFPFGEDTAYADLGRKIRVYHLTAAFREDDHVSDSQALFQVCESPGPGMLVHPTRGAVMAACRSVKVKDSIEESAGETTAELEFVEANAGFGAGSGFGGSLFGILSTGLSLASQTSFLNSYRPAQAPQPWTIDVIDTAQRMITVTAAAAEQSLTADSPSSVWRTVLKMQEVANDDGLAANPVNVDTSLVNGFAVITDNIQVPKTRFTVFRKLANAATTAKRLPAGAAHDSEQAVLTRQRILSAIGMAEAAMGHKYSYIDEGLAAMDAVLAVLDDEARAAYNTCDNALFMELKKYAIQFNQMMNDLSYRLPGVVRVDFAGGVHPLVAAYAIYRDAKRHRDLEPRNIIDANGRIGPLVIGVAPA
jgi:prophage DNA circulation protein